MEWLIENWFWMLLGLTFVFMHFFGHGRHKKQHISDEVSDHRH